MYNLGEGKNLEAYNRLAFSIYPDCDGAQVVNMDLSFTNADTPAKEGYNRPSGSHHIPLVNKQWNHCTLEIDEYQRDRVLSIAFSTTLRGKDTTTGDSAKYYIDNLVLQQVESPDPVSGWIPAPERIVYSTTGYFDKGSKTAIMNTTDGKDGETFRLTDISTGHTVYTGTSRTVTTTIGTFHILDFTPFNTPGEYCLTTEGGLSTQPFRIGSRIWEDSEWRVLNFIFCQRCGYAVPGVHGACHADLTSQHDGRSVTYNGGWHDAGDLSQQTLQTADVMYALFEASNACRTINPALSARLKEEAEWGLEFVLKNRLGRGWHASSMGLLIWTDGIEGTLDDISSVRTQCFAFDNFLYAAYEAYAALSLTDAPMMQEHLRRVAEEDFRYALDKWTRDGYDRFIQPYEHTYGTSHSQYRATISWAASQLYHLTGKAEYARLAAEHIGYVLQCQHTEPVGEAGGRQISGFFYRDTARRSIVHNIHQSREQVYAQALEPRASLCPSPCGATPHTACTSRPRTLAPCFTPLWRLPQGADALHRALRHVAQRCLPQRGASRHGQLLCPPPLSAHQRKGALHRATVPGRAAGQHALRETLPRVVQHLQRQHRHPPLAGQRRRALLATDQQCLLQGSVGHLGRQVALAAGRVLKTAQTCAGTLHRAVQTP